MLEEVGANVQVIEYLLHPLTEEEIKSLLKKLDLPAKDLVRKSEPLFKEKYEGKKMSEAQWIKAMAKHPILIERPIVVKGNKAVIARPAEKLKELLK